MRHRLTVRQVRALNRPGRYADGGTLFLRVAPGGSRQWVQRLYIRGKRCDVGLGSAELVSLAEARELAWENRRIARRGGDPLADRRKATLPIFRKAAEATLEALIPRWRGKKTAANWWAHLERHAFPIIGDKPVDRIGREDVLRVLTPIWTAKPESARRVRRNIKATLQWAVAHGYIDSNPAGEAVDGALPRQKAVQEHRLALPYRDIGEGLDIVERARNAVSSKLALRFLILTAGRSGEIRKARWSEVVGDLWVIPGRADEGRARASRTAL